MQIIKPLRLGVMTNAIPGRPRSRLAITGLVGFDLLNPESILTEQAMWAAITPLLGEQGALDAWTPKRQGEVLLWGDAVAPAGQEVPQMNVSLAVGEFVRKSLVIKGDRHWEPTLMSAKPSASNPFVSMPLTYERAFGGPDLAANPVGTGHDALRRLERGDFVALPNVEYPDNPVLHPSQAPLPAGFMPFNMDWPGYGPGGTYDNAWRRHLFPAKPLDFNWQAFNVAPLDQRVPGFFGGAESIELTGFHPQHARIASRIPALNLRFFTQRKSSEALIETPAVLDTLCLFPSSLCGVLLYRSEVELLHGDDLQHIASVMLACEKTDEPRTRAYYEEVFSLRTGEQRGLYALSDYQLMPAFSVADKRRLEARRDEVRQEQAGARLKKDAWFAAYAAASIDFKLPDSFFSHPDELDTVDIPIITDLDNELGNVDMAGLQAALDKLKANLLAKADLAKEGAAVELAKVDRLAETVQEFERTDDVAPLLALVKKDWPTEKNADTDATVSLLRSVADRLESDPAWSVAQATKAVGKPFEAKAIAQALKCGDQMSAFDKAELLKAQSALEQDESIFWAPDMPEARVQFVDTLRQMAGSLSGDTDLAPETPTTLKSGLVSADQFLQSLGDIFCNGPADQVADASVAALRAMPGTAGVNFEPLKTALDLAAQEQPALLRQMGVSFTQPPDAAALRQQMVASMQDLPAEANVAKHVSGLAPQSVKDGIVDWDDFLNQLGVGELPPPMPVSFAAKPPDETSQAQALRRANSLALGEPGVFRLGPDLPAETPEEIQQRHFYDDLLKQDDPVERARSNSFTSVFLQAAEDAKQQEGELNETAQSLLIDRMTEHAYAQPPREFDPAKLKEESSKMLATSYAASTLGHSICREVLPESEKLFRRGRQAAPVALIERADITPEIALAVGAVVRQQAALGVGLAGRDLAGADLRGAKLAGVDLTGAFLEHANLAGADLTGALCEGAVFSGACLNGANFHGALLTKANFSEAQAVGANFSAARLHDANLQNADFSGADLSGASLGACKALYARFARTNLDRSDCQEAIFVEADLTGASLLGAVWFKAQFIQAKLNGIQARGADLQQCLFAEVEANGCDFSGADLRGVIAVKSRFLGLLAAGAQASGSGWAQSELVGADFSRAHLAQAGFMAAKLDGVDFSRANLRRAVLLNASLRGSCLDGAQMYESSLRGADLTFSSLRYANLHSADLGNTKLELCDLTGARCLQTLLDMPSAHS